MGNRAASSSPRVHKTLPELIIISEVLFDFCHHLTSRAQTLAQQPLPCAVRFPGLPDRNLEIARTQNRLFVGPTTEEAQLGAAYLRNVNEL